MAVDLSDLETPRLLRCPLRSVNILGLSTEDAAKLTAALEAPHIHGTRIAAWLHERGVDISEDAVQRHRRGACRCPR